MIESVNLLKAGRPTIADLAKAAGLSVATVDRVINNRLPVRAATAARVREAAAAIGYHAEGLIRRRVSPQVREVTFGFILQRRSSQFYQSLGDALVHATSVSTKIRGRAIVEYLEDLSPRSVTDRLRKMAARTDAVALVAADHPHVNQAVADLRERDKPVVALITDISSPHKAGYVGMDWRKVGRTAGWAMMSLTRDGGKVAIVVGSHRYQAQELSEMSFRSYLREHAPHLQLLEPLVSLEDPRIAYEAFSDLLRRTPNLSGVYVAGGGLEGVMQALRDPREAKHIVAIGQDLTEDGRAGLIDGTLDLVMSHPRATLASATVEALQSALDRIDEASTSPATDTASDVSGKETSSATQTIIPVEIYTPENI